MPDQKFPGKDDVLAQIHFPSNIKERLPIIIHQHGSTRDGLKFKKWGGKTDEWGKRLIDKASTIKNIAGTFGGINLEDIAAPDCFIIEDKLKEILDIPVFHDDQHGTAIITTAALINALDITKKKIDEVKIVVNGAGASAMACANLFKKSGVLKITLLW